MTTKREFEQRQHYYRALQSLGFTYDECEQLRRISMTLRRWHEGECGTDNGCIERDEQTGKAYWRNSYNDRRFPINDRETGAKRRLAAIIGQRNGRPVLVNGEFKTCDGQKVSAYIQGDPRGAALYILRPSDVPQGQSADSYYTRGICVF